MDRALEGKVVLVTGGGVRVGKAIALRLGQAGADVAVHFHSSAEGAEDTARAIREGGRRAEVFRADLGAPDSSQPLVEAVEAKLGPIDILVNSAALFDRVDFLETPLEVLDRQWAVNTRGPYLLTQAVARGMVKRGGGEVVNVVDLGGGFEPWKHYSAYCMTKAALAMLTRCLALELAPLIRVNGVAPGTVLPPEDLGPQVLESLRQKIPQQRFGSPEDVASVVHYFLTGPRFITGQILAVDGGRSLA